MNEQPRKPSSFRWWICGLLFFATTINYIDRQVIGVLKPTLSHDLQWSETDYATIVMSFQAAYAAGYLFSGRFMDVVGARLGYAVSVGVWSLAAMAHGLVSSVLGFSVVRGLLGIAEGGNFPAAIKTVSEWFPSKERALATGLFNAGSNFGPILTPLVVPSLALRFGWRSTFVVTGLLGSIWIVWWWRVYRRPEEHPNVSESERAHIQSDPPDPSGRISWAGLLKYRPTWAFAAGTLLTSPIWWFYLFWAPDFFSKQFHLDLKNLGWPLVAIYLMADVGSVGGGWLSSALIKKGWTVGAGRKTALLVCALCVVPVYFATAVEKEWAAVLLFGLAAAGHQGYSANLYTLTSDNMPRFAVSSVVGIGGMAGSVAAIFFSLYVGQVLQKTNNYQAILHLAPWAYLIGFLAIHLLLPKFEQVTIRA